MFNEPGSPDDDVAIGFENARLVLTPEQLLRNIRAIQARNNIKQSETLVSHLGACSLDVEMETGTGKTYVYIKTIFELNKRYGWSKFIVVVPSIATASIYGYRRQADELDGNAIAFGNSFVRENARTETLKYPATSQVKYDLIGKIAEGTTLTRRTVAAILAGIEKPVFACFKQNPEEFITKAIRLINDKRPP